MLNYNNLISDFKKDDKVEDYLNNFFTKKNYKEYEVSEDLNSDQEKAIRIMFESKKKFSDRIDAAFAYDPFCLEAFFAYFMTAEDVYLKLRFDSYMQEINEYPSFDTYQKHCFLKIIDLYIEFLLDISNITGAIKMQRLKQQLSNSISKADITRLAYMYFSIENADEFYQLYLNNEFGLYEYLLLIVTLLKHDEETKAKEALNDMFDNVKFGTYLDHVWDLDQNVPEQKEFMKIVNDCYEDLMSIPTFFSWVNKTRERYGK